MEWFEAVLLGLLQGLTEFLPVSSSGHLEIGKALLGVETSDDLMFTTVVHAATVLSTIVVFHKQIWGLLKGFFEFKYNDQTDYLLKIAVSMVPIFIVGVFSKTRSRGFSVPCMWLALPCLPLPCSCSFLILRRGLAVHPYSRPITVATGFHIGRPLLWGLGRRLPSFPGFRVPALRFQLA